MVAPDANVLLYAYEESSPHFEAARSWLEATFRAETRIGVPMQSILAFLRISTNVNVRRRPITMADAVSIVDGWLARPRVKLLTPGPGHWAIFRQLCLIPNVTGRLTTDLHLAALAMEYDATLVSADRDFSRIPGLRLWNPLGSSS